MITKAHVPRAHAPQSGKSLLSEAHTPPGRVAPARSNYRKPMSSNKDPAQPRIKTNKLKKIFFKNPRKLMKKDHPGKVCPFTSEGLKSFLSPPPTTYTNIVDLVGASSLWICLSRGPICGWSGVEDCGGGWDHLGFCPTLTGSQMPQLSLSLKLTWILEIPRGHVDAALRASAPHPGLARTLSPSRSGWSERGGRQTEGEADTFLLYPSCSLTAVLAPFLSSPSLACVAPLTSSSVPSSTSFPSSSVKASMFQTGTSGVGASGICVARGSSSGSGSG